MESEPNEKHPVETRPIALPGSRAWDRSWHARDYRPEHLEGVVEVWRKWSEGRSNPLYSLAEVITECERGLGVVITHADRVIGAAVARIEGDRAWIMLLAQDMAVRNQGLGSALLAGLEERLTSRGVSRISALVPATENRLEAFANSEFTPAVALHFFERRIALSASDVRSLASLGAAMPPRGLWRELAGMTEVKSLIEARLILPLSHPDIAAHAGVKPPRAAILFGPPGTGKSTFAQAIASRLRWPFLELHPAQLAEDERGLAGALRARFAEIAELENVVVFIDEIDEIAARRETSSSSATRSATNELLKLIPSFRQRDGRLFLCATNFIREVDHAFLRHGRFDYVLPVGVPDAEAREAIWKRYLPSSAAHIDTSVLADASEGFSPADIEFAARRASQRMFEEHLASDPRGSSIPPLTDGAYLAAIAATRATVTEAAMLAFEADVQQFSRS